MLKQRVLTAIVLLAIVGLVMASSSLWPFFVFITVLCACAGWEWWRLTLVKSPAACLTFGVVLLLAGLFAAHYWISTGFASTTIIIDLAYICVGCWLILVLPAIIRGDAKAPSFSWLWTLIAPLVLASNWLCLAQLHTRQGPMYVLSLFVVIWIADIAAYFGGKRFGKHKLAPNISPGKTIEGAVCGVVGVIVWILISAHWQFSYAAHLVERWGLIKAIGLASLLAIVSIVGDLFESLLKRRAGIKDSSNLLPGHGGVFDRIDAVIAVVPLAFLLTAI